MWARQLFRFGGTGAHYAGGTEGRDRGQETGKGGGGTSPTACNQPRGRDDDGPDARALRSPGSAPQPSRSPAPSQPSCLTLHPQEASQGPSPQEAASPAPVSPAPVPTPRTPDLGKEKSRLYRWRHRFIQAGTSQTGPHRAGRWGAGTGEHASLARHLPRVQRGGAEPVTPTEPHGPSC